MEWPEVKPGSEITIHDNDGQFVYTSTISSQPLSSIYMGPTENFGDSSTDNLSVESSSPVVSRARSCLEVENNSDKSSDTSSDRGSLGRKTKGNRKLVKLLFAVISLIGISVGIAILSLHLHWSSFSMTTVITAADMSVRIINETFQAAMTEPSSSEFRDFGVKFCTNVLSTLYGKVKDARCKVTNLRPGSIIVNFSLELLAPENVTLHQVEEWLSVSTVGVMETDPSSLQVFANSTEKELHLSQLQSLTSTCLSASLPILPLSYTFPHHCGDYQVCISGLWRLEKCPYGLEFAYGAPEDSAICTPPSPSTYCAKRRSENGTQQHSSATIATTQEDLTSPPMTVQPVSLTTSEIPKSSTSSFNREVTPNITSRSTETSSMPSSYFLPFDIETLFICPRTGRHFLPARDTYPRNCSKYQDCNDGYSHIQTCPEGTFYAYAEYVCTSIIDSKRFCNLMETDIFKSGSKLPW